MLQHKYRGKRKEELQIWVYGALIVMPATPITSEKAYIGEFVGIESGEPIYEWAEVWPDSVGLYTGEKDPKEEELYSGDIVEDSEVRYEIRYGSWSDAFECGGIGFYLYPVFESESFVGALNPDDIKVLTKIGDIHNNPELLVSEQK